MDKKTIDAISEAINKYGTKNHGDRSVISVSDMALAFIVGLDELHAKYKDKNIKCPRCNKEWNAMTTFKWYDNGINKRVCYNCMHELWEVYGVKK